MAGIVYQIVEHDGGWAYKLDDVFSETFSSRDDAVRAASIAADEQRRAGESGTIEFQDREGRWHHEWSDGEDRPSVEVDR